MKLLVKIPTRGRRKKFFSVLDEFRMMQSGKHECHYLISLDTDDVEMNNPETISDLAEYDNLTFVFGERAGKIGSVNRDMDAVPGDWDILLQPADDWKVLVSEWDDRIVEEMELNFDDGDGVLWFFDGYNRSISTLSIMGKKYYERFGYIYYPEYRTFWPDAEFTEVADRLGRLAFIDEVLFKHEHPDWTHSHGYDGQKAGYDELYHENDKPEDREYDEHLFYSRLENNFDLKEDEIA